MASLQSYGDHRSGMQLREIYSLGLGLVFPNIVTALLQCKACRFHKTLSYPSRLFRGEQLALRKKKLKAHQDRLTAHTLHLISHVISSTGIEDLALP
ncbi:hypothetical protein E4U34_004640 [Claviceps purpurea]|nr:hypothetical protein E4U12_006147 [Claviceps purpurea]KAG6155430.1 hypothetical protein E4U37_001197 [Claviceps purpurea]KAG6168637.1 hypothetical protein E4U27_007718 [Claviceps purpurea]KAG6169303.1 hypothetical protein E4U51_001652 [Claviceps purpurea]KAG6217362.1 hypothetical protein E4U34_004640 [Claviceps purpurea]